jgi:hypothetical protein
MPMTPETGTASIGAQRTSRQEATAFFCVTTISAARASGCGTPDPEPSGTPVRVHRLQRISGFGHTPDPDRRQLSQSWNLLACGRSALAQPWIWQEGSVLPIRFSVRAGVVRCCFTSMCRDTASIGHTDRIHIRANAINSLFTIKSSETLATAALLLFALLRQQVIVSLHG